MENWLIYKAANPRWSQNKNYSRPNGLMDMIIFSFIIYVNLIFYYNKFNFNLKYW